MIHFREHFFKFLDVAYDFNISCRLLAEQEEAKKKSAEEEATRKAAEEEERKIKENGNAL